MHRSRLISVAAAAALSLIFTASVHAQPTISPDGVVNAASLQPGLLSPGQIVAIRGEGLGPEEPVVATPDAEGLLPTTLAGVQATIGGQAAPLLMVGAKEIRAQAPYELAADATIEIQITVDGVASNAVEVETAAVTPEIFREQSGRPVAATVRPDGTMVLPGSPVEPGGSLMLFATGGGHTQPPSDTGRVAQPPYPTPTERVTLRIGGVVAQLDYAGSAPGYAGLLQLNAIVPESVAPAAAEVAGDEEMEQNLVPVELSVGQGRSETVFVPINHPGVNNPPLAEDDQAETDENASVLIPVLANDSDVDQDALTVAEAGDGEHGETAVEGDSVRYTPENGFAGLDSFEYTAADQNGGSATAKVTVTVNALPEGENKLPKARGVDTTVISGRTKRIQLRARDDDGDVLDFSIVEGPSSGSLGEMSRVNANLAEVVYTSPEEFEGLDGFEFKAEDDRGGSSQASVVIDVLPQPPGPQFSQGVDDHAITPEDTPILVHVLANDKLGDTGEALMIGEITSVQNGETEVGDDGVTFTPEEDFEGSAGFSYILEDALGTVGVVDANVQVTPVNDPPEVVDLDASFFEDELHILAGTERAWITLAIEDSDTPLEDITVTMTSTDQSLVANSSIHISNVCENYWEITFDVKPDVEGELFLSITVSDGEDSTQDGGPLFVVNPNPIVEFSSIGFSVAEGQLFGSTYAVTYNGTSTIASTKATSSNQYVLSDSDIELGSFAGNLTMNVGAGKTQPGSTVITVTVTTADGKQGFDTLPITVTGSCLDGAGVCLQ